jgi:hypothetical protein
MAIGIDRSAGYAYAGTTGVLNGVQYSEVGQSLALYVVASLNLSSEDDAANEAFEAIIQLFPPVLAYYSHATTGAISLICDGVNAPDASGARKGAVNLSSATVTNGTSFVVS